MVIVFSLRSKAHTSCSFCLVSLQQHLQGLLHKIFLKEDEEFNGERHLLETDSKKTGQHQKFPTDKKSTISELSS